MGAARIPVQTRGLWTGERGIRSFDATTRNLFDLAAIAVVHGLSHLPIVADPSHGTGHRDMVIPMARAGRLTGRRLLVGGVFYVVYLAVVIAALAGVF